MAEKKPKAPMEHINIGEFNHGQSSKILRSLVETDKTAFIQKNGKPILKAEMNKTITSSQKTRLNDIRTALIQNRIFPEKVIKYLWDDAFKFNTTAIFDTEENKDLDSLEAVIRMFVFENRGRDRFRIFKSAIRDLLFES